MDPSGVPEDLLPVPYTKTLAAHLMKPNQANVPFVIPDLPGFPSGIGGSINGSYKVGDSGCRRCERDPPVSRDVGDVISTPPQPTSDPLLLVIHSSVIHWP